MKRKSDRSRRSDEGRLALARRLWPRQKPEFLTLTCQISVLSTKQCGNVSFSVTNAHVKHNLARMTSILSPRRSGSLFRDIIILMYS